jgi:hypothetical protein
MAMKRCIYMVGCLVAVIGTHQPALAADAKKNVVRPPATSSPVNGPTTSANFHMPPSALQREMHALERSKHLLEMSARNDHSSHEAIAARHLDAAINELKQETKQNAQTKHAEEPTRAASSSTPGVRR